MIQKGMCNIRDMMFGLPFRRFPVRKTLSFDQKKKIMLPCQLKNFCLKSVILSHVFIFVNYPLSLCDILFLSGVVFWQKLCDCLSQSKIDEVHQSQRCYLISGLSTELCRKLNIEEFFPLQSEGGSVGFFCAVRC